jgi:NCAIR mutase (PurE)-related protein
MKNKPTVAQKEQQIEKVFETKKVVTTLSGLMDKVTKDQCTPQTVEAACKCANAITDIMKVHLEAEKIKFIREDL